jgi:hypothetical protein
VEHNKSREVFIPFVSRTGTVLPLFPTISTLVRDLHSSFSRGERELSTALSSWEDILF